MAIYGKTLPITRDIQSGMCASWTATAEGITPVEEVVFRPLNLPTCVSDCGLTG